MEPHCLCRGCRWVTCNEIYSFFFYFLLNSAELKDSPPQKPSSPAPDCLDMLCNPSGLPRKNPWQHPRHPHLGGPQSDGGPLEDVPAQEGAPGQGWDSSRPCLGSSLHFYGQLLHHCLQLPVTGSKESSAADEGGMCSSAKRSCKFLKKKKKKKIDPFMAKEMLTPP